jgi:hypothetical protein
MSWTRSSLFAFILAAMLPSVLEASPGSSWLSVSKITLMAALFADAAGAGVFGAAGADAT